MERKTISQAQIYVRDALNRANQRASVRDFAGAVKTLLPAIKRNLDIPILFEKIREFEINKLKTQSGADKFFALLSAFFQLPIIRIIGVIDPLKAMAMCEAHLASYVDNPMILNALAAISDSAGAPWGVVSALKTKDKLHPGNQARMRKLADAMQQNSYLQKEITAARALYNDTVNQWNTDIYAWPTKMIVASRAGYTTRIPFTASAEVKAKAREVFF